jgi:ATP-dependent protease Clp ATPase subunit
MTTPNQYSKSTPPLAINYKKNKSSRMPVMSVRDEREKLKIVSPFFNHYRALSHSMDQEKVECTKANILLARYCVLHMQQRL